MSSRIIAFIVGLSFAAAGYGQVIYTPVQYQHGQKFKYYYGGNDPLIFMQAERDAGLLAFRPVDGALPRVYSDLLPFGNAYIYGFRAHHAYNQAHQSIPRYFVKGDLLQHAVEVDGALVVPPTPPRHSPTRGVSGALPAPAAQRKGVIIIIPKKPAQQQKETKPVMFVSSAR